MAASAPARTAHDNTLARQPNIHRVLLTGGTGVLGSAVVPVLSAAGHDVLIASHLDHGAVVSDDATSVPVSVFDRPALASVLDGVDAILHLATRIPTGPSAIDPTAWRANDKLRAEATAALVDAALESGVTTFVYPSVCFVYADGGTAWLRSGAPIAAVAVLESTLAAEREVARFAAHPGTRGIVLRLGGLYGPSSSITRSNLATAARGVAPIPGPSGSYTATLWERDAGTALAAALDAPSGVYDVVDDDPLPRSAVNECYLTAVDGRPGSAQPSRTGELARTPLAFLLRSHRVTNSSFRQTTGWRPSIPSVADAVPELALIASRPVPTPPAGTAVAPATTTTEE